MTISRILASAVAAALEGELRRENAEAVTQAALAAVDATDGLVSAGPTRQAVTRVRRRTSFFALPAKAGSQSRGIRFVPERATY